MSYINAFVRFDEDRGSRSYPVNCFRTDVQVGDVVVVNMQSRGGELKLAAVIDVEYLNWSCANTIVCLASEAEFGKDGLTLPAGHPITRGMVQRADAFSVLENAGWTPRCPKSKAFKAAYSYVNTTQTALIFFRDNGVDVQVLNERESPPPTTGSLVSFAPNAAPYGRHFLSQSPINVYEHILQFAEEFKNDRGVYNRYFVSLGSNKKITEEIRTKFDLRSTPVLDPEAMRAYRRSKTASSV